MEYEEYVASKFEELTEEYLKFERIPDKLHICPTLCGYLKVASLYKNPAKFSVAAEHDVVYMGWLDDLRKVTEEDIVYLLRCGISFNDETNCFMDFC